MPHPNRPHVSFGSDRFHMVSGELFSFPLTINLFKDCFDFRPTGNNATCWYAFFATNGTNTQDPKHPNLHDWKTKYGIVRILDGGSFFTPQRFCEPGKVASLTSMELMTELNPYELHAFRFFCYAKNRWLLNCWVMTREHVHVL